MSATEHGEGCKRPLVGECLKFSTDGTRMGAEIAHAMGTASEQEILDNAYTEDQENRQARLTGMPDAQAEWDSEDGGGWWP